MKNILFDTGANDNVEKLLSLLSSSNKNNSDIESSTSYIPKRCISNEKKEYNFRPKNFWEYIGQEKAKNKLYHYIEGTKKRKRVFPHTLISGEMGSGKTTLAQIIANELKVGFIDVIASEIKDMDMIFKKMDEVNGGVFFQDEIHSLQREMAEKLYPIMEDFKFNNLHLKPFTLIGATTEMGEILVDRKPLYRRFKIKIELEGYTLKDLIKISMQYKDKMFKNDELSQKIHEILALNCRNLPCELISLLESTIYFDGDVKAVLDNCGIIYNGFTQRDLKVLKYIGLSNSGVGLQSISNYLGTSEQNYLYGIEPYLLQNGLIIRMPRGRKITPRGLECIKLLEEKNNEI